jgi:hypothetical protein
LFPLEDHSGGDDGIESRLFIHVLFVLVCCRAMALSMHWLTRKFKLHSLRW